MTVFNSEEFYPRLHRIMSLLDADNIKILQTMKEFGPRNLQQIARRSKLPYSTVYARVSKLLDMSALRTWVQPNYSKIGLVKAMVLATPFPGKEPSTQEALTIPGFWLRIIRCTGEPNGYYSLHAVPTSNQHDFHHYLDQLVSRGVMKDYQVFWLGESFSPLPNFEYYDSRERSWRFEWKEWLQAMRSSRNAEDKRPFTAPGRGFDRKDLIILKELAKDARVTLADLSKMLSMTLPATKYRFDRLIEDGYIADYVISILPFMPELSDLCEVRLDFTDENHMKNAENVLRGTPFVLTITPIVGLNSLAVRMYIPRQEMRNLWDFLSSLARESVVADYSYLHLDPSTQQSQTLAYKYYTDGSGWHYDNREYLQAITRSTSVRAEHAAEEAAIKTTPVLSLQ